MTDLPLWHLDVKNVILFMMRYYEKRLVTFIQKCMNMLTTLYLLRSENSKCLH